jgi:putative phage-type endonuclease
MKLIDLQQNTPEWHKYRNTRIGASDFALFACHKGFSEPIFKASLNENIYNKQNNIELADNIYMQRGREEEPILNAYFNELTGGSYTPIVIEHSDNIYSSLDGYDPFFKAIVEYKTTSKSVEHEKDILQYYVWQILHQMYCSDKLTAYCVIKYFGTVNNPIRIYKITHFVDNSISISLTNDYKRNINSHMFFIKKNLSKYEWLDMCNEYLSLLNAKDNDVANNMLNNYFSLDIQIKQLTEEQKNIKLQIQNLYPEGGVCGNYTITKSVKNSTKYAEFIKDNQLVVDDKYKSDSVSFRITNKFKE